MIRCGQRNEAGATCMLAQDGHLTHLDLMSGAQWDDPEVLKSHTERTLSPAARSARLRELARRTTAHRRQAATEAATAADGALPPEPTS